MASAYQPIGSGYKPAGQGYAPIQKPTAKQNAVARAMAPMIQHAGFKNGRPFSKMIPGQQTPESVAFQAADAFDAAKAKKKASAVEMPTTPTGMQQPNAIAGANPGENVPGRFGDMMKAIQSRAAAGKEAVATERANQVTNPAATVDRSRAAMASKLAQDGVTDLGGGTRAMSNKYGTGFAQALTPEQFANRAPAVIRDEKGTVDVGAMMANRGKSTTTPYVPGSQATPALNMDAVATNRANIATMTTNAIPGAGARLAKDRNAQVASYTQQTSTERAAIERGLRKTQVDQQEQESWKAKNQPSLLDTLKPATALTPPPAVMAATAQPAPTAAPAPATAPPAAATSPLTPPPAEGTWQYGAQQAKAKADARAALPKQQADEYDTRMGHLFALLDSNGIDPASVLGKSAGMATEGGGRLTYASPEVKTLLEDAGFPLSGEAIANQLGTGRAITNAELLKDLSGRKKREDWPKFAERLRKLANAPLSPLTQPPVTK